MTKIKGNQLFIRFAFTPKNLTNKFLDSNRHLILIQIMKTINDKINLVLETFAVKAVEYLVRF